MNKSVDKSINKMINQSVNKSINQDINKSVNESINENINKSNEHKIAVIFDFDGTISDSFGNLHEFFKHSSRLFNKTYPHLTKEELKENFLEPFTELYLSFGFDWDNSDEQEVLTKEYGSSPILGKNEKGLMVPKIIRIEAKKLKYCVFDI